MKSAARLLFATMNDHASCSVFLPQAMLSYAQLLERTRVIEKAGYQGMWIVDHMWAGGMPDLDFLEAWTAIAGLCAHTERIRLGVLVTCNSYRNPGMLAKSVATADHISGGRIELGMGAGWMEAEYRAYGYDFPAIGVRLAQLEESLEIITRLFSQERTSFAGKHYTFCEAPFAPKPLQENLPITIGGGGTRVLMRLVARYAARWNCPMPTAARLSEHLEALAAHCDSIGRDVNEITIGEQVAVVIGRDDADLKSKRELAELMIGGFVDIDALAVCGTPAAVVDGLRAKMAAGVSDFAVLLGDLGTPESIELFAAEVMPHLHEG